MRTRRKDTEEKLPAANLHAAQNTGFLAAYLVVAVFAVIYVPYFVPVRPATSDSYVFGYNNAVGCVLLLLLALIGAFRTHELAFDFPVHESSPKVPRSVLCVTLVVIGCSCLGFYLLSGRFDPPWEGMQILNRVYLLTLRKTPYVDFEFPWGPAFLYLPQWLGQWLHLNLIQSYAVIWGLATVVGVYFLYVVINWIDIPARNRTTIFLLFSSVALVLVGNMGLNYTLLRYVCPLVSVLVVFRLSHRNARGGDRLAACLAAILFSAILFLVSPEVAVSHVFACGVLLWPTKPAQARWLQWVSYVAVFISFALLLAFCYRLHMLDSLLLDGGGGNSFPIAFGPATLAYFGAVYIGACYLVQRLGGGRLDNAAAILLYSIPMCAAALGRCDAGHVLLNGIGFFLVSLFWASATGRWWRVCRNLFIACPLGLCVLIAFLATTIGLSAPAARSFPAHGDIASLYTTFSNGSILPRFEIPFSYGPNAKGYIVSNQIDYGFFYGGADANTPQAIGRQIDELKRSPENSLLLTADFAEQCVVDQRHERVVVSALLGFPYLAKVAHLQGVREPLCDYIRGHYTLAEPASDRNFGYGLWVPKTSVR